MAEEDKTNKILKNFKVAYEHKRPWLTAAQEDFEFTLGKQWEDKDVATLRSKGVEALTINRIRPNIALLTGIESQNRTDYSAFPEGQEDSIVSDIATRLVKNVAKTSGLWYKTSQGFECGLSCGESMLEPYMDYSQDVMSGELKFKVLDYNQVFPEPGHKEYDLSDCRYLNKVTYDLTDEQLISLFPEQEDEIKRGGGKLNLDAIGGDTVGGASLQRQGYPSDERSGSLGDDLGDEKRSDLLENYYKKWVPVYYVIDLKMGGIKETASEEEAKSYRDGILRLEAEVPGASRVESIKIVKRIVPEIWRCATVGNSDTELVRDRAWFFPRWKTYHLVPFFCYWLPVPLKQGDRNLIVQGITRGAKGAQIEHNRRRTQELRHLNTSVNSGLEYEEDQLVNPDEVRNFGSSPGVHIVRRRGTPPIVKHQPKPLSSGHSQMAAEHAEDMKAIFGINADLLAMTEGGTDSGRAIALRQKQGLVMVQRIFDNLSQTKVILGKFILSQLGEVFDPERAVRVIGESFVRENFSVPVIIQTVDPVSGQPIGQPVIDPMTGQPQMRIDEQAVQKTITQVLNDMSIGKYDVAVGESAANETVKFGNYMMLLEMIEKGIPIPPDVIIDESTLPQAAKEKIKAAIQQQMAMPAKGAA